jgi:hypothetical protein
VGLYNFQKRFAQAVSDGSKTHTIRGRRARPDKAGNTLHLYTGLRQKGSRLLLRAVCTRVEEISITHDGLIKIEGRYLSRLEQEELAVSDGFESAVDMLRFWDGRLPFEGHVIHWKFPV